MELTLVGLFVCWWISQMVLSLIHPDDHRWDDIVDFFGTVYVGSGVIGILLTLIYLVKEVT